MIYMPTKEIYLDTHWENWKRQKKRSKAMGGKRGNFQWSEGENEVAM